MAKTKKPLEEAPSFFPPEDTFGSGDTSETARQIGKIVVGASIIEHYIFMVFAMISAESPGQSFQRFYELRSTRKKEELFNSVLNQASEDLKTACKYVWRCFKSLARQRNFLAHATYMKIEDELYCYSLVNERVLFKKITAEYLNDISNRYRILGTDALTLVALLSVCDPQKYSDLRSQQAYPPNKKRPEWVKHQGPPPPPTTELIRDAVARLGLKLKEEME